MAKIYYSDVVTAELFVPTSRNVHDIHSPSLNRQETQQDGIAAENLDLPLKDYGL